MLFTKCPQFNNTRADVHRPAGLRGNQTLTLLMSPLHVALHQEGKREVICFVYYYHDRGVTR